MNIANKKIIIFDLDGTITPSKSNMDEEMSDLLCGLLMKKKIAIIGGGPWKQFQAQFLSHFHCREELLENLFLFPTTATRFYKYRNRSWAEVYADLLSESERQKIKEAFAAVFKEIGYRDPAMTYGEIIEDRGTQISFSVFGQDIVKELGEEGVRIKAEWRDKHDATRQKLASALRALIPEFEVRTGGLTTIDVTKKGVDKAYGIWQIEKLLDISVSEMLFVGDALYPGGNDHAAIDAGVETVAVSGPEETKKIIQDLL